METALGVKSARGRLVQCLLFAAAAAATLLLAALSVRTAAARLWAERGWSQLTRGALAESIGSFLKAEELRPGMGLANRGLGEAYFELYRRQPSAGILLDRAERSLRRAVEASPADVASLVRLWHIAAIRDPGDWAREYERASALARRYPLHLAVQQNFLTLFADLGQVAEARSALREDFRRRPALEAALFLVSNRQLRLSKLKPLVESGVFSQAEREILAVSAR